MRPMYFDRQGKPISLEEWARRFMEERTIAKTDLANGRHVLTVWLGLDHGFGRGPPVIFETMVFSVDKDDPADQECERYSTEAAARLGHEEMAKKWYGWTPRNAVLVALAAGEGFGIELADRIRTVSGGVVDLTSGSLYPLLRKLESDGLITHREELDPDRGDRPRNIYSLVTR